MFFWLVFVICIYNYTFYLLYLYANTFLNILCDLYSWNGYKVYVHCVTSALDDWLIPSLHNLHKRNQITMQLKVSILNEPTNARYLTLLQKFP